MPAARLRPFLAACALLVVVSGCASKGPGQLMNLRAGSTAPDEFAILPTRGLELPSDMSALPDPTPAGRNLAQPDARAAAYEALGGSATGGLRDPALTRLASSADPAIRTTLATEDEAFRRRFSPRLLERMFGTNVYFRAYDPMALDPQAELARWRQAGATTPAAPSAGLVR